MVSRIDLIHRFIIIILCMQVSISSGNAAISAEPITVGVVHSEIFPYATMMKNSFEMALDVVNREGGVKGRPLELVYADDRGEQQAGENAVRKLIKKDKAVMLVGGYSSTNTIHTARLADKLDVPFLITTAADDRITQRKWKNVYRLNPPVNEYAKGLEALLQKEIKPTSMAIVYENSPFGTGGAMRMMWFCRENDIEIRKIIPYHKERASPAYFQGLLKPVRQDSADVIYMLSYLNDAVVLVKTIRELQIDSLLIGGGGGFTHHKFPTMAGTSAEGLLTATLWNYELPYPGAGDYYKLYLESYSAPPDYHGAEAYSSLFVVADVLNRAENLHSAGIRKALDETDMQTPFGPVKFQSYGKYERQNSVPATYVRVTNGRH